jgi:Cdc6-like AAA superfamily ATPase
MTTSSQLVVTITPQEKLRLGAQIGNAFRPGAPIERYSLFAGRALQTERVIGAVVQPGQHAILYGERGVGKTSLARVFAEILSAAKITTVRSGTVNCDPTDDYSSLWHKAFREITFRTRTSAQYFSESTNEQEQNLDSLVEDKITPDDVRFALAKANQKTVIVFDEFDRLKDNRSRILIADTIKNLSDHTVDATLILVGVAQSVTDLISQHQSIDRALVQVPMPRMSREELGEIIDKGLSTTEITVDEIVRDKIIRLSHGLPHFTHLLSLESGKAAINRGSKRIEDEDFASSVREIVANKQTIASAYYEAVSSSHKSSTHKLSLLACALSPIDEHGFFISSSVAKTMAILTGKDCSVSDVQRHLNEFVTEKRKRVLERHGSPRRFRYRFSDPMIQPYTIIHSLADKLISESQLWIMDQPFFGMKK